MAYGSIPARAGEPRRSVTEKPLSRVYPRTGGGTWSVPSPSLAAWGLSPHGRGNQVRAVEVRAVEGSIPARAGEPTRPRRSSAITGVYPRTGGGTGGQAAPEKGSWGLSPHGRGNHGRKAQDLDPPGSIPARAGEPRSSTGSTDPTGVYPRTGGGTSALVQAHRRASHGVYPRTGGGTDWKDGLASSLPHRVYPRTGGGTALAPLPIGRNGGLSPHGRGNPQVPCLRYRVRRSIPARAGEPTAKAEIAAVRRGLSPHGRGNHRTIGFGFLIRSRVYPRTGGGTSTKQQTDNAQLLRNKCRVCVLTGS